MVAALTACGGRAERRGDTVLFASGADLQSINPLLTVHPLARQVQKHLLLTTLARYDSTLRPVPYLAAWSWSSDQRTLTFRIRPGVRWHDGRRTVARDAAWTLNTARDVVTGYPRQNDLAGISFVDVRDDSTLVVQFTTPQPGLPDVFTDLAMLPAHLLDTVPHAALRRAPWNSAPVGNGPFRFVAHEPNRRWVFAADSTFPALLGGPPALDRIIIVVVDEPLTKLAALTSGELDFAGINPAHAAFVRRDARLAVLDYPLLFTYGVVFNTRRPPLDDVRVRRAVSLALDRQEVVDGYLFGFGTPAGGPVPDGVPGGQPAPVPPADTAAARALLAGRDVRFELLTVGSGEAALEQLIQSQLARAGIRVTIRQLELSAFLDRVYGARHDFDAAVMGIPGDLGLGYLGPLLSLAGVPTTADPRLAQRRFADAMPVAFLYHTRGVQGMNRRVEGVTMDLRGELVTAARWRIRP